MHRPKIRQVRGSLGQDCGARRRWAALLVRTPTYEMAGWAATAPSGAAAGAAPDSSSSEESSGESSKIIENRQGPLGSPPGSPLPKRLRNGVLGGVLA